MDKSSRSKKSTQEGKAIELAEEGRAIGKKPSQDSGNETLVDHHDQHVVWPGNILRTDQYDVSSEAVGAGNMESHAR